jgi:hypothetical protein
VIDMDLQAKRCMECGTVYFGDEVNAMFATVTVGLDRRVYPKTTCNPCRLTKRTQVKSQNRFVAKARDTIRRHTVRLSQWVSSTGDLADRFGWEVKRVAHDMEHAWKNGCPDCGNLFSTMVHGLGDLSVDIIDPANPPFWGINTRIMCITCNRKKARTPPRLWGANVSGWARWNRERGKRDAQPRLVQSAFEF